MFLEKVTAMAVNPVVVEVLTSTENHNCVGGSGWRRDINADGHGGVGDTIIYLCTIIE